MEGCGVQTVHVGVWSITCERGSGALGTMAGSWRLAGWIVRLGQLRFVRPINQHLLTWKKLYLPDIYAFMLGDASMTSAKQGQIRKQECTSTFLLHFSNRFSQSPLQRTMWLFVCSLGLTLSVISTPTVRVQKVLISLEVPTPMENFIRSKRSDHSVGE